MNESYYVSMKAKLLKDFDRASGWFRPHLIERFGPEMAERIRIDAKNEYVSLIPQIPYIGGTKVHMTSDLLESVILLAYLQVLESQGCAPTDSRDILLRATQTRLAQYPKFLLKIIGKFTFTKHYLSNLQRQAQEADKREFPGGFVYEIVIGDGKEFDWGINFSECGICKFYQAQNAARFIPLVCPIDYTLSDAFGYGLVRTETLAEGGSRCNPRMKRGRQTEWRLSDGD